MNWSYKPAIDWGRNLFAAIFLQEKEGRGLDLSTGLVVKSLNSASASPLTSSMTSQSSWTNGHLIYIYIYMNLVSQHMIIPIEKYEYLL